MSARIRFTSASVTGLVLAKIGHPQRNEPLQTSREVFHVREDDQETLTALFLRPFKSLGGHRFHHHSSLEHHEMNACAAAIFASADCLLERGCEIAKRLYAKTNHPNIKSGDLCIAMVRDIEVNGELTQGICILKSESVVPFLSISTRNGDLELSTEQGINPEKIDKGCLILNHLAAKGYYVMTFDRSGGESRFWVRDFLGVVPITDAAFLTNKYADLAVSFVEKEKPRKTVAAEDSCHAVRDTLAYFEDKEKFSLQEFEQEVLKTPDAVARFAEHRARFEEDQGQPLADAFEISKKDITKARKKVGAVVKLDTGVEIHIKPAFVEQADPVLERGYDDVRGMKFIKVFFNEEQ